VIYDVRYPAIPAAVRAARSCIARALHGRVSASTVDDVELLATELMTNSIRHSGIDAGEDVVVRLEARADRVRLEVSDRGLGFDPGHPEPSLERGNGWGLYIVEKMSDRWGVDRNGRTSVWFEIDV
jgi:anti-sigma regulatory factor (Ser/Thr protein kinase)